MSKNNNRPEIPDTINKPKCGIVMPISPIENCTAEHWLEVLGILKDVIFSIDFTPNLVSDADDIGIIQKRIIQNLYNNEIVLCDVSAKNPNVTFELGMRLAFDKPTIIIKDDKTDYTFDTSVIEHLTYPRDLRFGKIIEFKENLKKKIEATYRKSKDDPKYSTFLKNFGQYKIAHLQETEISPNEFIVSSLNELKAEISKLKSGNSLNEIRHSRIPKPNLLDEYLENQMRQFANDKKLKNTSYLDEHIEDLLEFILKTEPMKSIYLSEKELRAKLIDLIPPF